MAPKRFSMDLCAKGVKRSSDDTLVSTNKLPKAADVIVNAVVPKIPSTRAAHGPVVICLYKFTNSAADVLPDDYAEKDVALYQIQDFVSSIRDSPSPLPAPQWKSHCCITLLTNLQIDHDCRNSIVFRFKAKFEAFLRATHQNDPSFPDSVDALSQKAGLILAIAPGDNLKGGSFVPWRVALYVAGDQSSVANALPRGDSTTAT